MVFFFPNGDNFTQVAPGGEVQAVAGGGQGEGVRCLTRCSAQGSNVF